MLTLFIWCLKEVCSLSFGTQYRLFSPTQHRLPCTFSSLTVMKTWKSKPTLIHPWIKFTQSSWLRPSFKRNYWLIYFFFSGIIVINVFSLWFTHVNESSWDSLGYFHSNFDLQKSEKESVFLCILQISIQLIFWIYERKVTVFTCGIRKILSKSYLVFI